MLFSLIIPCYNSDKTINKLFNSLTRQNISKNELEIIVIDDNSTDKSYLDIIKKYEDNFIIRYYETNVDIHCPGNTRQVGLEHATGDWICFADHDDLFEDNAFDNIKEYINNNKDRTIYVISTIVNMYDENENKYIGKPCDHFQILLHGKWYNRKELIEKYNIHFKKDLLSHEDGYFNNLILTYLIPIGKDWDYLNINTYKWSYNKDSLSRRKSKSGRSYLYDNFDDYLNISKIFIKYCNSMEDWSIFFINQVIMTVLHGYFYYEAAIFNNDYKKYKDILQSIKNYIHYLYNNTNITSDYMIYFVYYDPNKYDHIYNDCSITTGKFICKTSFRDFIIKLS